MAGAPGGQAGQDGGQVAALVGEVVDAALGGPLDHALLLEQAQALGQQVGRDPGQAAPARPSAPAPSSSSRTTSRVHRSPTTSSERATGRASARLDRTTHERYY